MRVLVCGDRNWEDFARLEEVLDALHAATPFETVIEGGAPGADRAAHIWAHHNFIPVEEYPAEWERYGRAAGPVRNRQMLGARPNLVVAFHDRFDESRGTADMVRQARKAGLPVRLFTSTEEIVLGP